MSIRCTHTHSAPNITNALWREEEQKGINAHGIVLCLAEEPWLCDYEAGRHNRRPFLSSFISIYLRILRNERIACTMYVRITITEGLLLSFSFSLALFQNLKWYNFVVVVVVFTLVPLLSFWLGIEVK